MHLYRSKTKIPDQKAKVLMAGMEFDMDMKGVIFPEVNFKPIEDENSGFPLDFNLVVKYLDGEGFGAAWWEMYFQDAPLTGAQGYPWCTVNGINTNEGGFSLLSTHDLYKSDTDKRFVVKYALFKGSGLLEFYDLSVGFVEVEQQAFRANGMEVIELPECTILDPNFITDGATPMRSLVLPKMTDLGDPAGNFDANLNSVTFNSFPQGSNYTFNNALKTANAGAMHGDIQWLIDNKNPNITWVD